MANVLTVSRPIVVPLTDTYRSAALELAVKVFAEREPITVRLGLTPDDIRPFMVDLCAITVSERAGVVAIDPATDHVIGFALGKDFTTPMNFEPRPRMRPILHMLEQMDEEVAARHKFRRGDVWHLVIAGIPHLRFERSAPAKREKGALGAEMTRAAISQAVALGYRTGYCQCTNINTRRIASMLRSRLVAECVYADYIYPETGERCFAGVRERSCMAYLVDLSDGSPGHASPGHGSPDGAHDR